MNTAKIKHLNAEVAAVVSGETAPARVYTLEPDGKGGFVRKPIDPEEYRRRQAARNPEAVLAAVKG